MSELDEDEAAQVSDEEEDVQQSQLRDRLSLMNNDGKATRRQGFFSMFVDDMKRMEENDLANEAINDVEMIGDHFLPIIQLQIQDFSFS